MWVSSFSARFILFLLYFDACISLRFLIWISSRDSSLKNTHSWSGVKGPSTQIVIFINSYLPLSIWWMLMLKIVMMKPFRWYPEEFLILWHCTIGFLFLELKFKKMSIFNNFQKRAYCKLAFFLITKRHITSWHIPKYSILHIFH